MERVGVRELRQNLSVYLRRVKEGEALEVTEHGRPVAVLGPRSPSTDWRERLIADGRLIPGRGPWGSFPEPIVPTDITGTEALRSDREGKV